MIAQSVMDALNKHLVEYQTVSHPESFSSAETAVAAHIPDDHIAKGVLVKNSTGYLLVVIPGDKWVNFERLQDELNRDFELAPESEVDRLFPDCCPGAVPPLGYAYDIETVLDEGLTTLSRVFFEAGDHERLILVQNDQFQILMGGVRHGHFSQSD
ncbi:MAG: YbaK/EbsC family protein [Candidatus Sedimenticola sp. (ex Thyasira tokunagai)]